MTFLELANKRYSARKYKDQPIEKEKLRSGFSKPEESHQTAKNKSATSKYYVLTK